MRTFIRGSPSSLWKAAAFAVCAVLFMPAAAEDWVNAGSGYGSFAATAVDRDSIAAVPGMPHTLGAWFRYRFATSVDCSPPRGCYAASQRNYYHVNCNNGTVALVQRLFLDLNDNVITRDDYAAWYYYTPYGVETLGAATVCSLYRLQYPNSLRYSPHVNPWPPH